LNSCVSRDVLSQVMENTAGDPCPPVSPDYTGGAHQLMISGEAIHVDVPLYVTCGHGNGSAFRSTSGEKYLDSLHLTENEIYGRRPSANRERSQPDPAGPGQGQPASRRERVRRSHRSPGVVRGGLPGPVPPLAGEAIPRALRRWLWKAVAAESPDVRRAVYRRKDFWLVMSPDFPLKTAVRERLSALGSFVRRSGNGPAVLRFPGFTPVEVLPAEEMLPRSTVSRERVGADFPAAFRDVWTGAQIPLDVSAYLPWPTRGDRPMDRPQQRSQAFGRSGTADPSFGDSSDETISSGSSASVA
jgi:hypothetical protein